MKKTIIFLALFICTGLQAQEVKTTKSRVFVNTDVWNIPNGADTSKNKEVAHYFDINDTIVSNYYAEHPESYNLITVLNDSQISYLDHEYYNGVRVRNHRWALYRNGASQVQEPRIIHCNGIC